MTKPQYFMSKYADEMIVRYADEMIDDKLQGDLSSVDIATKENLENLVKVGEDLLKSPVSHINLDTGGYEPVKDGGTYEEALQRFAKLLSEERKLLQSNSAPAKEEEN
ncbi:hypothetical protein NC653_018681 [Populus alba x Populus x berolinensis]|uniref:Uncharacterized protein n=1 Tax=Populus alba x Populus x berolinensis TaxID=444605 RepID=A0AAD6QHA2_9ROSI|nr:hypothetical protein NC653_018681 [Populus alba x Populus x berolinensis]